MNVLLLAAFAFIGLVFLAIILFFIWKVFQKSVTFYKELDKGNITLHVKANCDVRKITVVSKNGKTPLQLVRTKVAPGEEVEFVFPESKAKLIVECVTGTYEYEVH